MLNVQETDLVFDSIAVRMYEPMERSDVLPGVVYYHGGGFVYGNLGRDCIGLAYITYCFSNTV